MEINNTPYKPIPISIIPKNFSGLSILSEYLPAIQLPNANPDRNAEIIIVTA